MTLLFALGLSNAALAENVKAPKNVQGIWIVISDYGGMDWRGTKIDIKESSSLFNIDKYPEKSGDNFTEKKYITGKELLSYFKNDSKCKEFPLMREDIKMIRPNQKYLALIDNSYTAYYFIDKNTMFYFPEVPFMPCHSRIMMKLVR